MPQLEALLLAVGLLALALGLVSRLLRQVPISEPIVAVALGVTVGPVGLGLVDLRAWGGELLVLEHAARVTLALGLMAVALRVPFGDLVASRRTIGLLVALLMPLMWLASALLAWWILGLPIAVAALLGAVITPTDPIVASTIVTGSFVERRVPRRIRRAILAESGFNDGLAVPFVAGALLVLGAMAGPGGALGMLLVGWKVAGALLVGVVAGHVAGRLLVWAERHDTIERSSFLAYKIGRAHV